MNSIIDRFLLIIVCMSAFVGMQASHHDEHTLTADGPYIIYSFDGSARVITVSPEGNICDTTYS